MTVDYLIVGQGLAGTLLARFLLQAEQRIHIIDNAHKGAASKVAAGVINPVTGRRFVKSWRIEELLPFAVETYRHIEAELGMPFYYSLPIVRSFSNRQEECHWLLRSAEIGYERYILDKSKLGAYQGRVQPSHSYGEVGHSAQVDVSRLVEVYRDLFLEQGILSNEVFDYEALETDDLGVTYKGIKAKKVIFCEGQQANNNPYFNHLPFNDCKGEALIVKIPNANFKRIFKHRVSIVPIRDECYWVGATMEWDFEDDAPTEGMRNILEEKLNSILTVPFEILEHKAAIRPTTDDRRPFLGVHPQFPQLYILNGLGTKGASLGPFFAQMIYRNLLEDKPLDEDVNITRFEK